MNEEILYEGRNLGMENMLLFKFEWKLGVKIFTDAQFLVRQVRRGHIQTSCRDKPVQHISVVGRPAQCMKIFQVLFDIKSEFCVIHKFC